MNERKDQRTHPAWLLPVAWTFTALQILSLVLRDEQNLPAVWVYIVALGFATFVASPMLLVEAARAAVVARKRSQGLGVALVGVLAAHGLAFLLLLGFAASRIMRL